MRLRLRFEDMAVVLHWRFSPWPVRGSVVWRVDAWVVVVGAPLDADTPAAKDQHKTLPPVHSPNIPVPALDSASRNPKAHNPSHRPFQPRIPRNQEQKAAALIPHLAPAAAAVAVAAAVHTRTSPPPVRHSGSSPSPQTPVQTPPLQHPILLRCQDPQNSRY